MLNCISYNFFYFIIHVNKFYIIINKCINIYFSINLDTIKFIKHTTIIKNSIILFYIYINFYTNIIYKTNQTLKFYYLYEYKNLNKYNKNVKFI